MLNNTLPVDNNKKWVCKVLLIVWTLTIGGVSHAQEYLLIAQDFESIHDSSWVFSNSKRSSNQFFQGQMSAEVSPKGEVSVMLPVDASKIREIVVKGWMKLDHTTFNRKSRSDSSSLTFNSKTDQKNKFAAFSIEGISETNRMEVIDDAIGFLDKSTTWSYFEKEITIPKGVTQLKLSCKNSLENSIAFFDNIQVEKRQLGFVKVEASWAKSVRSFNEKQNRLVKNGDFEEGGANWNQFWGFQLTDIAHSGNYACLIQNSDSGAWKGSGNEHLFKIPKGTKMLKVSAWIKAENIIGGPNMWETGAILLSFTDNFGNEVPGGEALARTVGTHDWKRFETFFAVSERATNFRLALQLAASTGKIYIDDIVAEPMTEEEYYAANILLRNPGFESLLSGWPSYAGEATTEQAHSGVYSLKVGGEKAAWDMRQQSVSVMKGKKEFSFSVWIKTVGVTETPNSWEGARVYIEFKDVNGISLSSESVGRAVGTTEWKQYTATISIPEDATEFTISCGRANVSGNAYFDDVQLVYPNEK